MDLPSLSMPCILLQLLLKSCYPFFLEPNNVDPPSLHHKMTYRVDLMQSIKLEYTKRTEVSSLFLITLALNVETIACTTPKSIYWRVLKSTPVFKHWKSASEQESCKRITREDNTFMSLTDPKILHEFSEKASNAIPPSWLSLPLWHSMLSIQNIPLKLYWLYPN